MNEFYFDNQAADKAVSFFEGVLKHYKGKWAGQPFLLQPWQKQIVRDLFGWKNADGTRKHRTAYIEVPRKSGKSTFAAGIALYLTFVDGEAGAEVYSTATTAAQAGIVFDCAKRMVEASPMLSKRAKVFRRSVTFEETASRYVVIAADAGTADGFNSHGVICDELHEWPNRDLWDKLITSTGARQQPLVLAITTAGYDRNSVCWEQHEYACKVRDGIINDPTFYGVIHAADEGDDWRDKATWAKAQPGLNVTISEDYYAQEAARAAESPAYENTFRRLLLNQWTEQSIRWLPMDRWDACGGAVDLEALKGQPCWAGLDLSSTTDISALVLLFKDEDGYRVQPYFWIPEENARKRERRDRVPYTTWAKEGLIEMTEGNVVDYDVIRRRINELGEVYNIREIAVDRWNATQITTQLQGDGFTMVPFGQGYQSMSGPTKELEKLILGGELIHGGNAVLRWMASNVSVQTDAAGNLKPDKEKSTEKIDGIVALVMAIGRMIAAVGDNNESVYEERGLLVL